MSKYKAIETQITNPDHICRALDDLAVVYEVAKGEELALYGYQGDRRQQTGAVVVRRHHIGSASNDIGWSYDQQSHTYQLYLSRYDQGQARSMQIVDGVNQRCALLKLQDLATLNGFSLEVTEDDQNVQRVLVGGL